LVVFRNAGHGEINVVYRRDDGNIGWIDPAVAQQKSRSSNGAVAQQKSRSSSGAVAQQKVSRSDDGAQLGAKKARKRR
jgi:hypothetical protein